MARTRKLEWDSKIKIIATMLSGGAALVSILSFVAGRRIAQQGAAAGLDAVEVSRIAIAPSADTAFSLGDTLHFTTLAADAHGQALHAPAVHWTVDDPSIASVDSTGQVVALRPGNTFVMVAIGSRAGRVPLRVQPRLVTLAIIGDSVIPVAEGTTLELRALGSDARGNWLTPTRVTWTGGDSEVAEIDSLGTLRGIAPGVTRVAVASAGLNAQRVVRVVPVPATITLTGGTAQRGPVGKRLAEAVSVQVVSRSGLPVPGVHVGFDASASDGAADPALATTDSLGVARTRWTLGTRPGRQRLAVAVPGIDSAMTVIAEGDPLPGQTTLIVKPDSLLAEAGTALTDVVAVQATDSSGVVLADLPVTWTVLDGGSIVPMETRTDSMGTARARWALGPRAGRQRARVQVGNPQSLPPVTIAASATPGPVAGIEIVSGNKQQGMVGSALKQAVVLRALDSLGNAVDDVPIRIATRGAAADTLVETGADGRVSVRVTLGDTAGKARLVARLAPRGDSAVVTATAAPGAAKTITFVGAATKGTAGRTVTNTVRIVVTDRYGNPVPKAPVRFSVHAGKAVPAQGVTDAEGRLSTRWTLGPKAGKQSLTATIKSPAVKAYHVITAQAAPTPKSRRAKQ